MDENERAAGVPMVGVVGLAMCAEVVMPALRTPC
jgi:hypothetical protein